MTVHRIAILVLALAVLFPATSVAQDEPLGQPAGWAVEETVSLVSIVSGSQLFLEPDPGAMVITILPEVQLPLIETRESWVKVRFGDKVGWVDLEGKHGPAPAPAQPVHFVVTEREDTLEIGDNWQEVRLGPYKLHNRVEDPPLIQLLHRVASQHARVYAERYGLEVGDEFLPQEAKPGMGMLGSASREETGPPIAGVVLLFDRRQDFLDFQRAHDHQTAEGHVEAYFHSPRTVLMYRGRESRQRLAATLMHELTHLVSWRELRVEGVEKVLLPPWLEEGMAEDLSLSRFDRKGQLVAAPLGPGNLRFRRDLGVKLIELENMVGLGGTAPSVQSLLSMDNKAFVASDVQVNYLMSAMWIRYLLDDSELATGFRDFLASVKGGGPADAEVLRSKLDRTWEQLSQGFRRWISIERARVGL